MIKPPEFFPAAVKSLYDQAALDCQGFREAGHKSLDRVITTTRKAGSSRLFLSVIARYEILLSRLCRFGTSWYRSWGKFLELLVYHSS